jgi:amidase
MEPQPDATAQAERVASGEVSVRELVEESIRRIEALNPELNAVIHPLFEKALETEPADGPFRGVPILIKDLVCQTAGDPYHEGTRFLRDLDWHAQIDTWLAARLRAAGFVFVGKTNTPEFGILPTAEPLAHGASRNPWNTDHSTGGSSGGSAAAVAAGMVAIAHANDGGGSIRIPASCCGLVGLKPSRARVSLAPLGDFLSGLGTELVVSRSVRDAAAVLEWVADPPPGEPYFAPPRARPYPEEVGADPGRLRVGIMTSAPTGVEVHPDCVAAAEEAGRALEALGHAVEPAHPDGWDDANYIPFFLVRWASGVATLIDFWSSVLGRPLTAEDVEPLTWALSERGHSHSASDYLSAIGYTQLVNRQIISWWQDHDLLLTPTLSQPPARLGTIGNGADDADPSAPMERAIPYAIFTAPFNATGQPAISLPMHVGADNLPIGVQLTADLGREDVLIRVASQLEEARPWGDRRPPVFAAAAG